ncbi:GNAT family N-acetyltransferase [Ulvibacterium sp.]|uniref:GNAT family N-acetyltransferase n=1 Tax=Ulvibacterium sp. TaxID=2665914 RepID=UPI0026079067|nr:GNAT family N-acetyltransferase [Ulvibacterium sp.]
MVIYKRTSIEDELLQILELQKRNLSESLSRQEKYTEGFVTVSHSLDQLRKMHQVCPHIIAKDKDKDKVIGYALCMHPRFAEIIAVLRPMFQEIKTVLSEGEKYMVMGQICIDKAYRKKGVFRKLYQTMKSTLFPDYPTIITEVDTENQRSLEAHYAVGFKDLKKYRSVDQEWQLILLK